MLTKAYDAIVAGGGPAGVGVVGALLHYKPKAKIAWIDPDFKGGRLAKQYRDVSSNTKVSLFLAYAQALDPFQHIIDTAPKPNGITNIEKLDQNRGCRLGFAADMLSVLTKGLTKLPNIDTEVGRISKAQFSSDKSTWNVYSRPAVSPSSEPLQTRSLIMCTGSVPTSIKLPTSKSIEIDLDTTLDRQKLRAVLPADTQATVGIIGTSHSAIVVIMNLYELATTTHPHLKIRWFVRSDLTYAEQMDGWILRDNTGLKGASANFAKEHLEPEKLSNSPVGRYVSKVECSDASDESMRPELEKCTHIVQAIGYKRDNLPEITVDGHAVSNVKYDPKHGNLQDDSGSSLPRLYGAGIAFPERVTDPSGNTEYAVGMWKFMKYLKRVTPEWV